MFKIIRLVSIFSGVALILLAIWMLFTPAPSFQQDLLGATSDFLKSSNQHTTSSYIFTLGIILIFSAIHRTKKEYLEFNPIEGFLGGFLLTTLILIVHSVILAPINVLVLVIFYFILAFFIFLSLNMLKRFFSHITIKQFFSEVKYGVKKEGETAPVKTILEWVVVIFFFMNFNIGMFLVGLKIASEAGIGAGKLFSFSLAGTTFIFLTWCTFFGIRYTSFCLLKKYRSTEKIPKENASFGF